MAGAKIALSSTTGELQQDANGHAKVNLPLTTSEAGYAVLAGERHDGIGGGSRIVRAANISLENRLKAGIDSMLFEDTIYHTVINYRKYFQATTTMTITAAGNAINLNAGNSVASAVGALIRTYRAFPLLVNFSTLFDAFISLAQTPQVNNVCEVGIGIPGATAIVEPTDGIYMQITDTGALQLVANFNGVKTTSGPITFSFVSGRVYHIEIFQNRDRIELHIDKVYLGGVDRSLGPALSQNSSGCMFARCHNTAATSLAQQLRIHSWAVGQSDIGPIRPIEMVRAAMGDHLLSALDGSAVAQLANYANSAAPASATLSNTAAGYATLGGQFQFAAVAGAETDYALFAWQNPIGTSVLPGRNVIITGIDIDTFNMGAAVATSMSTLQWSIGIGASAVSLATADAAGARAPHRYPLGYQRFLVGAAIGEAADKTISKRFPGGLIVEPGAFVHIIVKLPVGAATASQIIRGVVGVTGYVD